MLRLTHSILLAMLAGKVALATPNPQASSAGMTCVDDTHFSIGGGASQVCPDGTVCQDGQDGSDCVMASGVVAAQVSSTTSSAGGGGTTSSVQAATTSVVASNTAVASSSGGAASGTVSSTASAASSSTSSTNSTSALRYVAYWSNYDNTGAVPTADQLKGVTHIVLAFVNMTTWTDFVYSTNGNFDDTTVAALKANAPGVKIMAAVGGWANDNDFRPIAADASLRQKFAKNCTSFIESWGLDGIDLDWEYPGGNGANYLLPSSDPLARPNDPADLDNFISLLKEVKSAFSSKGYILSSTLPSRPVDIDLAYPADKVTQMDASLDFWNLMTYDFTNRRDNMTNYQAGGIVVQTDLDIYKANGLDLTRINVGFPMYARWFQLDSASSCSSTNPIGCAMGGFENSEGGDTFRSGTYKFNDALNPGNATEEASWKAASSASNTDNSTALASAYFDTTAAQFWTWVSADDIKQTCLKYKSQVGGMSVWALNQDTNGASGGEHIQAIADCLSS